MNYNEKIYKWYQYILRSVGWASLQTSWCGHMFINQLCLLPAASSRVCGDCRWARMNPSTLLLTTLHKHAMGYVISMCGLPSHFVSIIASECRKFQSFMLFMDNNIDAWSRNQFLVVKLSWLFLTRKNAFIKKQQQNKQANKQNKTRLLFLMMVPALALFSTISMFTTQPRCLHERRL